MAAKGRRNPRYGKRHDQVRADLVRRAVWGQTPCVFCRKPLTSPQSTHLAHDDSGRSEYAGLAHGRCNTYQAKLKARRLAAENAELRRELGRPANSVDRVDAVSPAPPGVPGLNFPMTLAQGQRFAMINGERCLVDCSAEGLPCRTRGLSHFERPWVHGVDVMAPGTPGAEPRFKSAGRCR